MCVQVSVCVISLTLVWLLADVLLRASSSPGIGRLPLGHNGRPSATRQAHLVVGVDGLAHAQPLEHGPLGVAVGQGQRLGVHLQAQATRRAHMEEPVAGAPLPQHAWAH